MASFESPDFDVLIIGSGFSGIGMAIALKQAKFQTFVILEKAQGVGGTWRDNTYPGCACDVPSRLYSYSFAPNPNWSEVFAPQAEIKAYLEDCAERYDILDHVRFGSEVADAKYDDELSFWRVRTSNGDEISARIVVSGQGALHIPKLASIDGIKDFEGDHFHSASWPENFDLKGRKVGVVGTGASAIQVVPSIAPEVSELVVFQRNAPWIQPKPNWKIGKFAAWCFANVPFANSISRTLLYWLLESRLPAFLSNKSSTFGERQAKKQLRRQVKDEGLRDKLLPREKFGCKRVLLSSDYYPAIVQDHVTLETDSIVHVDAQGIRTDQSYHKLDTIIWCTGFEVTDAAANPLRIVGRDGRVLQDEMQETAKAYLGISVEGFPNFFMLMGPHTGLGHNSMIYMIECQIRHVMEVVRAMHKNGSMSVEVTHAAQESFEREIDRKMIGTVWASGCQSWYSDASGRITTIWPDHTFRYRKRTRRLIDGDYEFEQVKTPEPRMKKL